LVLTAIGATCLGVLPLAARLLRRAFANGRAVTNKRAIANGRAMADRRAIATGRAVTDRRVFVSGRAVADAPSVQARAA
jgi:hypothetical protein